MGPREADGLRLTAFDSLTGPFLDIQHPGYPMPRETGISIGRTLRSVHVPLRVRCASPEPPSALDVGLRGDWSS